MRRKFLLSIIAVAGIIAIILLTISLTVTGKSTSEEKSNRPVLHDAGLDVELVAQGLKDPTSMRFLNDGSIMVLQKNDGEVRLVSGGKLLDEPILQADVANKTEQGLLGVAVRNDNNVTSVFLYMTENEDAKLKNRIYKYNYDEEEKKLKNKILVLDLPGEPGPYHNGGKIAIGPDNDLYAAIGDLTDSWSPLDNEANGTLNDIRSAIVRVDETGKAPVDNPFYGIEGIDDKVYAYGIKNSFGIDFDPVTGILWDTDNGPDHYDEINRVDPGFNGGWDKVMGPIERTNKTIENDLVMFGPAKYTDPVFSWNTTIGVTDIEFFDSAKLGDKYENNIFVGDINNGNLYLFKVNHERNGLEFDSNGLRDLVADPIGNDTRGEATPLVIGQFSGRITDVETGPDGYLYVLTYMDGKIWKIKDA